MSTTPRLGLTEFEESNALPEQVGNEGFRTVEQFASRVIVKDKDENDPPATPADGDAYIIAATATGAWTGHEGKVAIALGTNAANGWKIVTPIEGTRAYVQDENVDYEYNGSAWALPSNAVVTLLQTVTITASSTSGMMTSFAGLGLKKVEFILVVTAATDDTFVNCRLQFNGATKTANYDTAATLRDSAANTSNSDGAGLSTIRVTSATATWGVGNASGEGLSATVTINEPDSTTQNKKLRIESQYERPSGAMVSFEGTAHYNGTDNLDGLEGLVFNTAGGNLTGKVYVYGYS